MKTIQQAGYTVLELMIVIAVSAGMFGIVATTFSGRQQQVQFTQAVRDLDSRIKDIRNDVSLGYYSANESVTCTTNNGNNPEPIVNDVGPGSADPLGSNEDCVYIGKALQFSPGGNNNFNADNDQLMKIFNIVGLRVDGNGSNPTTVADAVPTAIPNPEQALLKWGLRVKSIRYTNNANVVSETNGIAIFTRLNRGSDLQVSASDEAVQVSAMPNVSADSSESSMRSEIRLIGDNLLNGTMNLNNASSIVMCVSDAEDNRKATITFGGSISGSVIDFDNFNAADCS